MKTRIFLLFISLFIVTAVVHGEGAQSSGVINGDGVNLRAEPGPFGRIISVLQRGLTVALLEQTGQWYKVRLSEGQSGWIYRQFIAVQPPALVNVTGNLPDLPVDELITYAKSLLETKYIYGGDTLRGLDCSGFTMYVFAKFGLNLPHEADLQMEKGTEVQAIADLLPGDLVFFKTLGSRTVNHVGIFLGDNRFIHASSGYGAVRESRLDSGYYYNCYACGRRMGNGGRGAERDEAGAP